MVEFETTDPALQGEMTITYTLADADGGATLLAVHDGLPPGLWHDWAREIRSHRKPPAGCARGIGLSPVPGGAPNSPTASAPDRVCSGSMRTGSKPGRPCSCPS